MTNQRVHTEGCWRPDANEHCCGLRTDEGAWRILGPQDRTAWEWQNEAIRLSAELEQLKGHWRIFDKDDEDTWPKSPGQYWTAWRQFDPAIATEVADWRDGEDWGHVDFWQPIEMPEAPTL